MIGAVRGIMRTGREDLRCCKVTGGLACDVMRRRRMSQGVYAGPMPPTGLSIPNSVLGGGGSVCARPDAGGCHSLNTLDRDALEGGEVPPPPSRAPSLCPATVSLTASASFNGMCNRQ